jgi:hypothetical protein
MDLPDLYNKFISDTQEILECFKSPLPSFSPFDVSCLLPHRYSWDACVIHMHSAWTRFCRELIYLSAYASPLSSSGNIIPPVTGVISEADVDDKLKTAQLKPKDIKWGDPPQCIRAVNAIGTSNKSNISAAIGVSPSPVDNLRRVRNYFAHRNRDTLLKVSPVLSFYGITSPDPIAIIVEIIPPGISRLEDWITDLRIIAESSIQYP